jgi:uncharacterized protein (TIGR02246 family)
MSLIVAAGCETAGSPQGSIAGDREAIREAHERMQSASARADWDDWVAVYAEDAVVMIPNRPALEGREAIRAHFAGWPAVEGPGVELLEIEVRDDLAFVRGRYRITMSFPGMGELADSGKTLEIWRRQVDGSWRISRDMSSSDVPTGR